MKKLTTVLLLAGTLALAVASGAAGDATGDSTGPACSDIVTGGAAYNVINPDTGEPTVNTVTATIYYAAPTCTNVQYTLVVTYTTADGKAKTKTQTIKGDGSSSSLSFQINNVSSGDGTVCVYTTTGSGGKDYDRSPDTGCTTLTADSSGGG